MHASFELGKGLRVVDGNISFYQQMELVFDRLSDADLSALGLAILEFARSVNGTKRPSPAKTSIVKFKPSDFLPYDNDYVYKYFKLKHLDHFRKGIIRLGALPYYHSMENKKAEDPLEGLTILKISADDSDFVSLTMAGLNQYIFCSTDNRLSDTPNKEMMKRFGYGLVRIRVRPFAARVAELLNARGYKIYRVRYSNTKCFELEIPGFKWQPGIPFMWQMYGPLRDCGYIPNLFMKPEEYLVESEVRIAFEMPADVQGTIDISDRSLLDYLDFLQA